MHFIKLIAITMITLLLAMKVLAQEDFGSIRGKVVDVRNKSPLGMARITLKDSFIFKIANEQGFFQMDSLEPGRHYLITSYVNYYNDTVRVRVRKNDTAKISILLQPKLRKLPGVEIKGRSFSADNPGTVSMSSDEILESNPSDPAEAAENLPGVESVRRGPVGMDVVIRGLRGVQTGQYVNGSRSFAGGPARMDSPLSHNAVALTDKLTVVKGPYALSRGPGNLSSVELKTLSLNSLPDSSIGGEIVQMYRNNGERMQSAIKIGSQQSAIPFILSASRQRGSDYRAGNGKEVPAEFLSRNLEGKIQYSLSERSLMTLQGGYQQQNDVDFPARLLNAAYFKVPYGNIRYQYRPENKNIREIEGQLGYRYIRHQMTNRGKPTAQADSTRMPPFPLDIDVLAVSHTMDARTHITWKGTDGMQWKAGVNGYYVDKNAIRRITNKEKGKLVSKDFIWPEAQELNGGAFLQSEYRPGQDFMFTGTVRLDGAVVRTDSVSDFFKENVSAQSGSDFFMPSGALQIRYFLSPDWDISLSLGSVTRAPSVLELFSNRVPSTRAQTSAEFAGDPELNAERNNQIDINMQFNRKKLSFSVNPYYRFMTNYITVRKTDISKKLPLSPETVFQYTNADAVFGGGEVKLAWQALNSLLLQGSLSYTQAQNLGTGQPVLGIAPLKIRGAMRYRHSKGWYAAIKPEWAARQERTAQLLGENITPGYMLWHAELGYQVSKTVKLALRMHNITDRYYFRHLSATNPFKGSRVPESGRSISLTGKVTF